MKISIHHKSIFLVLVALLFLATDSSAITRHYYRQVLTGGGANSLDVQDGAALNDKDVATVFTGSIVYFYMLDADSGIAEVSPSIIAPDTNAGDKRWILQNVYSVKNIIPPDGVDMVGHVYGFIASQDAGDPDHDINVTAGVLLDSRGLNVINLTSEMTKRIDAPWTAGDDSGGLLTGSYEYWKGYNVFALRKDDDGSVDIGLIKTTDDIDSYLPTGYGSYRWIGFFSVHETGVINDFSMTNDFIYFPNGNTVYPTPSLSTFDEYMHEWEGADSYFPDQIVRIKFAFGSGGSCNMGLTQAPYYYGEVSDMITTIPGGGAYVTYAYYTAIYGSPRLGWFEFSHDGKMYGDTETCSTGGLFLKIAEILR